MDDPRTLADVGEFGLIEALRARIAGGEGVLVGPGDDAALVRTGRRTLLAADMLVEGVHFDLALTSPADAGHKAVTVNVSDIAAMGGAARYITVCLGAPASTKLATIEAIYDGIAEACAAYGVAVVGGDTCAAGRITLAIAVTGDCAGEPARRSGASPGDAICVTGALGAAAAGLSLLRIASQDPEARALLGRFDSLGRAHARPVARVAHGPALRDAGVSAMIDVSDGLARDAGHIAEESKLGARVDAARLPIAAGVKDAAAFLGVEPSMFAAAGGDEYELAFTIPRDRLHKAVLAASPLQVTVVGEMTANAAERVIVDGGDSTPLDRVGWQHFA